MKLLILGIALLLSSNSYSQTKTELERINFFPQADAFAVARYTHQLFKIDTPQASLNTKEVNNHSNLLALSYAHRFAGRLYVGVTGYFEEASENAVRYGIPLKRRFNSTGFKEPELFAFYRLREQNEDHGLIDLSLSYSPKGGVREVGYDNSNRVNGRPITRFGIAHGLWEEEWEFRTSLFYHYYGEGMEKNNFTPNSNFYLEVYQDLIFKFQAQHRLNPWLFAHATIGIIYRTTQDITDNQNDQREIQAGTGSYIQAGFNIPLSQWTVLEINYAMTRNDYFVKGAVVNLEGRERVQDFSLATKLAF